MSDRVMTSCRSYKMSVITSQIYFRFRVMVTSHIDLFTFDGMRRQHLYVVWAIKRENKSNGSNWARSREKRTGPDNLRKTQGGTFHLYEDNPHEPICTEICTVAATDVITYAMFWTEILGATVLQGSNFRFSYWFLHGPYNSAVLMRLLLMFCVCSIIVAYHLSGE